jgi:hypothetical protein
MQFLICYVTQSPWERLAPVGKDLADSMNAGRSRNDLEQVQRRHFPSIELCGNRKFHGLCRRSVLGSRSTKNIRLLAATSRKHTQQVRNSEPAAIPTRATDPRAGAKLEKMNCMSKSMGRHLEDSNQCREVKGKVV